MIPQAFLNGQRRLLLIRTRALELAVFLVGGLAFGLHPRPEGVAVVPQAARGVVLRCELALRFG
jgi:hypothetical protein